MATARFLEILRCNGVDQDATPHPGMVVPFKGENQVVLDTSGLTLELQHSPLNLQEFDGYERRPLPRSPPSPPSGPTRTRDGSRSIASPGRT